MQKSRFAAENHTSGSDHDPALAHLAHQVQRPRNVSTSVL